MLTKPYYSVKAMQNQRKSPEKLRNLQLKKLREIIRYAHEHVPYYRNSWKKMRINSNSIQKFEDVKRFPIINRKILGRNHSDFISDEYVKYLNLLPKMTSFLFVRSTSGTTGEPMRLYFNPDAKDFLDAVYARALINVGYNPLKPLLYFWWQQTPQKELYHIFRLFKKIYVPSEWTEEEQLAFMQKIRPEYIYYFPSALYFISRLIMSENIEIDFQPKLIISHAEILTERMRKIIEDAFDTKVYDQYGANEFNRIAWECKERNGYHIDADSVFIEIVDENYEEVAEGEVGKVLITGLVNKVIPLIRYELGDFLMKAESEQLNHKCGINLPVGIKSVEGRKEHSNIQGKNIITQKKFLEQVLMFLDKQHNLRKFQSLVDYKNKKLLIKYTASGDGPLQDLENKIRINNYKIFCKKVRTINKNKITGKILLLEKIKD